MGFRGYIVYVALLSAFVVHTVEGSGLSDIIRALKASELTKTTRDVPNTPEEAIVVVVLEDLDSNSDGKVALSEVLDVANRYSPPELQAPMERSLFMALAKLFDSDASGFVERSEMERAASIIVTEFGADILATVVDILVWIGGRADGIEYLKNVGRPIVFPVIDRDGDGQITQQEISTFLSHKLFRSTRSRVNRLLNSSDTNEDGVVTEAEFNQWVEEIDSSRTSDMRFLVTGARVAALGGFDF